MYPTTFPSCIYTALVILTTLSNAYYIDQNSCSPSKFGLDKLQNAFELAFSYARVITQNKDKFEDNTRVKDVTNWILGENAKIDSEGMNKWDLARLYLTNLNSVEKRSDTPDDVRIYYDTSRLEVTDLPSGAKKTHDKINNLSNLGDGIADCNEKTGIKAWTGSEPARHAFSTIQICPWYLKEMMIAKVGTFSAFKTKGLRLLDKGLDRLIPIDSPAGIDYIALFEVTMLHELTHTKIAGGIYGEGGSKDIDGLGNSYQWKNIRRLSQGEDSWENADSLAYWAFAVKMILEDGVTITENGDVEKVKVKGKGWETREWVA
ncbi:hypothetical protein K469DRAFT_809349 [Zopfia rhizophila CBS 207.26]|uniref:Lysine-specific metallo-endopeptidase domain-containing protein n=1 Tax=Zopfia rhizophila CBS 207.26 TaxID=1314779 RepID=A0A6A6DE35_9PEZI|nr:hypothetical protein K469DRAFT_809349 [Zopfia rhizophila CBS 207.26]